MIYRVFLFWANLKLFVYNMKIKNRLQKLRSTKKGINPKTCGVAKINHKY